MTERPVKVTEDDLKAGIWTMSTHLNMGGRGGQTTHTCSDFPELLICKGWSKKKGVTSSYRVVQVRRGADDYTEIPLADLDEVARVVTKVRQGLADDIEWEKADPTMKAVEAIADAAMAKLAGGGDA